MTCAVFTKVPVVMLMITPAMLPAFRIEPKPSPCVPSIVIALVIVTVPKPPGSRTSISPPSAVLEIAPAKVLQGAVRLHGLASLPTPETQVRVAWAKPAVEKPATNIEHKMKRKSLELFIRFRSEVEIRGTGAEGRRPRREAARQNFTASSVLVAQLQGR